MNPSHNYCEKSLLNTTLLCLIFLMMHSAIWSNSRSPWRNPNPNARLNPKVEAHREQNRIKQWNKIVQKHIENKQPEKALEFLKETLRLDAKNHYSLGMTAYLLLTYRKDFEAAKEMEIDIPIVVRLAGTNYEKGKKILEESKLKIISASDLSEAAKKIVKVTK